MESIVIKHDGKNLYLNNKLFLENVDRKTAMCVKKTLSFCDVRTKLILQAKQ